jgi:hypothetical protein
MRERRQQRMKRKLYPLYLMLKAIFEKDVNEPKALARAAGKPEWWARRRLKEMA